MPPKTKAKCFLSPENQIEGEALMCLSERALESLIPVIGHRMKSLKLLPNFNKEKDSENVEKAPSLNLPAVSGK